MTNVKIQDGADEFRIFLTGRFADVSVEEVRRAWTEKLAECLSRRFTVDISALSDYDAQGRKLLREMYHHGIHFAAATPASLVFLSEISSPRRRGSVTMLPEEQGERRVPKPSLKSENSAGKVAQIRSRAAGE
jgi:hypothetical protein